MPENFQQLLHQIYPGWTVAPFALNSVGFVVMLLVGYLFYFVVKGYIMPWVRKEGALLKPSLEQSLQQPLRALTDRLALLGPLVFYLAAFNWFASVEATLFALIYKLLFIYLYVNVALFFNALLNVGSIFYNQQSFAKDVPIKGLFQVFKLTVFMIAGVLIISELIDKTPLYLLSSLGALTAILLLIFKDTILGFVAGIQIATQRLVANGDWIEMPEYGADGDVLEVGLHTVKVQNFDKTITTIPTYKLISDSFKNWRGMSEADGRRIKRSFYIDIRSLSFIDDTQRDEILKRLDEPEFTTLVGEQGNDETNLGLFRRYCEFYLQHHPQINDDMTLMARLLAPCEFGVPLEVYCFSKDKRWTVYERIQATVMEHLLARLTDFKLCAYQRPADRQP